MERAGEGDHAVPQRADEGAGDGTETLVPTSLTDELVVRLENGILEGVYPPGTRLRQDELCERFGVSRTPVREALRNLQARNLVVVVPNRGAMVRIPSRTDAAEIYDIRAELEGYACGLAAAASTSQLLRELHTAHGRVERLATRVARLGSASSAVQLQLNRANREFHNTIHRAAGNGRLESVISQLERSFPTEYIAPAIADTDEFWDLNVAEHARIQDAIAGADEASARGLMRDHVLRLGTAVLRYLDVRGFWR
jgi:DNA-binding GntR family transcriptional regulator